jgi:activator of HSP90 ATPase
MRLKEVNSLCSAGKSLAISFNWYVYCTDGNICLFLQKEPEELVVKWRLKDYPAGHYAQISFKLQDQSDSTNLVLSATGVPKSKAENTQEGIKNHYFRRIGSTFGIGLHFY